MTAFGNTTALGLDIGQAAVKVVVLSRKGNSAVLAEHGALDCREGFLDQTELTRELRPWFEKNGWTGHEAVVAVPQYLASTETTEFPPGSERDLEEMVAFETRNLAGLSEEQFIADHQRISRPESGRNAALIGICRESVIHEQAKRLSDSGILLADFAIGGTALAGALLHLYPEFGSGKTPQLLLDIGAESSTVVVLCAGEVLHTGSLMFGLDRFMQTIAEDRDWTAEQTRNERSSLEINPVARNSPELTAVQPLVAELETAIENWRSQAQAGVASLQFSAVAICGGGATMRGMDRFVESLLGCPTRIVGVALPDSSTPDPSLMTAYGLALQGLGISPVSISLAPRDIRWRARRRQRFPALAMAVVLLACFLALVEVRTYLSLTERKQILEHQIANLDNCNAIVPDLENVIHSIDFHQRLLLPFVEKGNHAHRFNRAIGELGRAREKMLADAAPQTRGRRDDAAEGWTIYLADNLSFRAGKTGDTDDDGGDTTGGMGNVFTFPPGEATDTRKNGDPFMDRIVVEDTPRWTHLVAAVYTTSKPHEPYKLVRDLIEELNPPKALPGTPASVDDRLFASVDLMPENESAGREDIFLPWVKLPEQILGDSYRRFVLRLPFRELDVQPTNPGGER